MLALIALSAALAWGWLLLGHGNFWQIILPRTPNRQPEHWPSVTIIVPARDEAEVLPRTLPALLAMDYPGTWQILLVDDNSTDTTATIAATLAAAHPDHLRVIHAPPLPRGWSGKVHALEAGVTAAADADYVLFTDADILHRPGSLRYLVSRAEADGLDLHSLMVKLHCATFWEKMLIPAFVYFFQMLYPFAWSNDPKRHTAAAAGGVMLVRTSALCAIGGMSAIKGATIDDCALARAIKWRGNGIKGAKTLLSLVDHDVVSLRVYARLGDIWQMISRSAYTQLRYSPWLLLATIAGLGLLFAAPIWLSFCGALYTLAGWLIIVAMIYSYLPMIEFYRLNIFWAAGLPLAALIYVGATLDSAVQDWLGQGGRWKNRVQAAEQKL
jgi:hopene-associated glycosyltransferase HpnB